MSKASKETTNLIHTFLSIRSSVAAEAPKDVWVQKLRVFLVKITDLLMLSIVDSAEINTTETLTKLLQDVETNFVREMKEVAKNGIRQFAKLIYLSNMQKNELNLATIDSIDKLDELASKFIAILAESAINKGLDLQTARYMAETFKKSSFELLMPDKEFPANLVIESIIKNLDYAVLAGIVNFPTLPESIKNYESEVISLFVTSIAIVVINSVSNALGVSALADLRPSLFAVITDLKINDLAAAEFAATSSSNDGKENATVIAESYFSSEANALASVLAGDHNDDQF